MRRCPTPNDLPSPEDMARFGGDTRPCPECGTHVYDEAVFCHTCGHVMMDEKYRPGPKPWFVIILVLLLVTILYFGFR